VLFWGEFLHCGGRKRIFFLKKEKRKNPVRIVQWIFLEKDKMQKSPYFEERKSHRHI
jgi:hypothetical protein